MEQRDAVERCLGLCVGPAAPRRQAGERGMDEWSRRRPGRHSPAILVPLVLGFWHERRCGVGVPADVSACLLTR
jgi:hypothetical protein